METLLLELFHFGIAHTNFSQKQEDISVSDDTMFHTCPIYSNTNCGFCNPSLLSAMNLSISDNSSVPLNTEEHQKGVFPSQ
jgi:hypothetical protein